jgi:ribosome-associated protein
MDSNSPDSTELLPSKSQRKRDARVLFELGRDLVALSNRQLAALPVEADLLAAINLARSIKSHVARKRQVQFIAKMMRSRDVSVITEAMAAIAAEARQLTVSQHRVESWRDWLISDGDNALAVLMRQREHSDTQALRHLVRNARKESGQDRPPAAARKLFKLLRELDKDQPLPPTPDIE